MKTPIANRLLNIGYPTHHAPLHSAPVRAFLKPTGGKSPTVNPVIAASSTPRLIFGIRSDQDQSTRAHESRMTNHQKETAFLKQCIRYDESAERHGLEARITKLEGDERCVRRAVWLMALLAALSTAALGYAAVLVADYPLNMTQFTAPILIKVFCALGLGALICLVAFVALRLVYRKELGKRREECRRLAGKLLEARLGKPHVKTIIR